jgi:hypothetical protein
MIKADQFFHLNVARSAGINPFDHLRHPSEF